MGLSSDSLDGLWSLTRWVTLWDGRGRADHCPRVVWWMCGLVALTLGKLSAWFTDDDILMAHDSDCCAAHSVEMSEAHGQGMWSCWRHSLGAPIVDLIILIFRLKTSLLREPKWLPWTITYLLTAHWRRSRCFYEQAGGHSLLLKMKGR